MQFKGGKGMATTAALLCCLGNARMIIFGLIIFIAIVMITRYVSLGSMTLLTLYAILVSLFWSKGNIWVILWSVFLALLCIYRHHANIQRLLKGTENKLGKKP